MFAYGCLCWYSQDEAFTMPSSLYVVKIVMISLLNYLFAFAASPKLDKSHALRNFEFPLKRSLAQVSDCQVQFSFSFCLLCFMPVIFA